MESNHAEERHNNSASDCTGERLLLEKKTKSSTTPLLATILWTNPTNHSAWGTTPITKQEKEDTTKQGI
jgi:hypothetical protein